MTTKVRVMNGPNKNTIGVIVGFYNYHPPVGHPWRMAKVLKDDGQVVEIIASELAPA